MATLRQSWGLRLVVGLLLVVLVGLVVLGAGQSGRFSTALGMAATSRAGQPVVFEHTIAVAMSGSLTSVAGSPTYSPECSIAHALRTPDLLVDVCWTRSGEVRVLRVVRTAGRTPP